MPYNHFLDQFLMFYSQSEAGNGLTRGLENALARNTYVPTKLDRELAPAILAKQYRLVILTGNAGDGKTAFIQQVEASACQRGATITPIDFLGSRFVLAGRQFRTLYDGSVETAAISNQAMLTSFFSDFAGDTPSTADVSLIAALNEGKLIDFLSRSTSHRWLSKTILDHLQKEVPLPGDMVLINLNLRAVVDAFPSQTDSLFDQILDRYVADEFWAPCDACPARFRCPVKFNVDTFRLRSVAGLPDKEAKEVESHNACARAARSRLKSVFQMLHFRKRIHVTVRDLRSVLAFVLFGKHTCSKIEADIQTGTTDFCGRYYYNGLFNRTEKDRILQMLREFDVGDAVLPMTDSRLSFLDPKTPDFRQLFLDFETPRRSDLGRVRVDEDDLKDLYDAKPRSPEERTPEALSRAREYVVSLRRKLFFEGNHPNDSGGQRPFIDELVPYDNILPFMAFIESGSDPGGHLKQAIVLGISKSESIYDEDRGKENVCIRTRHDSDTKVRAFFTYPAAQFALERESPPSQACYIEFLPASLRLNHLERNISLEISLDLYETLMRIRDGYVPAAGEMRAFFLNLLMFKKQLMSTPSDRLILADNDYTLYQVSRTPDNGVSLSILS